MPGYHTIVEGMTGTGDPIVWQGAVKKDDPKPEDMTGGAFTAMQVDERVKTAIEAGSASDFFYFTEEAQGVYDMRPKLPEYGAMSETGPVFKLRENNNRMAKGMAQQFLDESGRVDFKKGQAFLAEFTARFEGMTGVDKEDKTLSPNEVNMKNGQWLCDKFQIPPEERADFINFYQAATYGDQYAFGISNFLDRWESMLENGIAFREMMVDEASDFNSQEFQTNGKKVRDEAVRKYVQAEEELKRLASIDPANEMDMIVVTECSGSARSNLIFRQMANYARTQLGEQSLEAVIGDGHFRVNLEAGPGQSKDDLKWDFHEAPVLGSFKLDDKTYYLTAEAFAQESDTFLEHPGMTSATAVGIYSDQDDFVNYYRKDTGVITDPYSRRLAQQKIQRGREARLKYDALLEEYDPIYRERDQLLQSFDDGTSGITREAIKTAYTGDSWERAYARHQSNPGRRYHPVMGVRLEEAADDLEVEARIRQRQAVMLKERIPEPYRERFSVLLDQHGALSEKTNTLGLRELHYKRILDMNEENPAFTEKDETGKSMKDRVESALDRIENESTRLYPARLAAASFIEAVVTGNRESQAIGRNEMNELEVFLRGTGFSAQDMREMAEDKSWKLLPPAEVRMEIQAGTHEAVEDFLKGVPGQMQELPSRSREFGAQNFDAAFGQIFSEEDQKELAGQGKNLFDQVYVDGVSARERYEKNYDGYPPYEKAEFIKCDIMRDILEGRVIDTALLEGDEKSPLIPLRVTTDVRQLSTKVLVSQRNQTAQAGIYTPLINAIRESAKEPAVRDTPAEGIRLTGSPVVKSAAADFVRNSGGAASRMLVTEDMAGKLKGMNPLYEFTPVPGTDQYEAGIRIPDTVTVDGKEVKFRENYNRLIKGIAGQFCVDGKVTASSEGADKLADLMKGLIYMYSEEAPKDHRNPLATAAEVRSYRDQWLCDRLGIPEEERESFQEFMSVAYSTEATKGQPLGQGNFTTLWLVNSEKLRNLPEVMAGLSPEGRRELAAKSEKVLDTLQRMADMDPVSETKAYVPTECSGSATFLARLRVLKEGKGREEDYKETVDVTGLPEKYSWDYHQAGKTAVLEDGQILTAEAFAPEEFEYFSEAAMTSDISFGVYKDKQAFEDYYKLEPMESMVHEDLDSLFRRDEKGKAKGIQMNINQKWGSALLGVIPQIKVTDDVFHGLEDYGNLPEGTTGEEKTARGESIMRELLGAELKGPSGEPDLNVAKSLFRKVEINGTPYLDTLSEELTAENYGAALDGLMGRMADYMDENRTTMDTIEIVTGAGRQTLTYTPPAPEAVGEKPGLFAPRAEKQEYNQRVAANQAAAERQARWEARNRMAQERARLQRDAREQGRAAEGPSIQAQPELEREAFQIRPGRGTPDPQPGRAPSQARPGGEAPQSGQNSQPRQGQRLSMTQLLDQLENQKNPWYHVNSKSYKEVMAALKTVNELSLQAPTAQGLGKLQAAYGRLGEACAHYLEGKGPNQSTGLGQERFALVSQVLDYQRQDTQALGNVNIQSLSGQTSWLETIEGARMRKIDIRGQQLERVGAVTSSRLKVEVDGKKGFFTPETKRLTPQEQAVQAAEKVTEQRFRDYFVSLAEKGVPNVNISPNMWTDNPQRAEAEYQRWKADLPQSDRPITGDEAFDGFARQYIQDYSRAKAADAMPDSARIVTGTRMDTRNVGMSRIAQLLGKPGLIAHSTSMEVETEDGIQKGVFMEFARGHDYTHEAADPIFSQPIHYETGAAQSQMADLQVLDLICGNVDRHTGNMFYDIREDENHNLYLAGIQGIDNDTSFGTLTAEDIQYGQDRLVGYSSLACINADTASAVMGLDKPALEYALKDILSQEEINAAWSRTQGLQDVIRQAVNRLDGPEDQAGRSESAVRLVYDAKEWDSLYYSRPNPDDPTKKVGGALVGNNYFRRLNQMQEGNQMRVAKRLEEERARSAQSRQDQAAPEKSPAERTAGGAGERKRAAEAPVTRNPLSFDKLSKTLGGSKEAPVTRRERAQTPAAPQDTKGKTR